MKSVSCFGIIPLQQVEGQWHVLLIRHVRGSYWSFPKGHGEAGEDARASASRELYEETGLTIVRYLSEEPLTESYRFVFAGERINKNVVYFLAQVQGTIVLQKEEIEAFRWVPLAAAEAEMTFAEGKRNCRRAVELLSS